MRTYAKNKNKKSHFTRLTLCSFPFCQISISSTDASEDLNQYGIHNQLLPEVIFTCDLWGENLREYCTQASNFKD